MKRRIAALAMPDVEPGAIGAMEPETRWVAPTELLVDDAYQRNLSEQSVKLIRRIVAGFDWRRYKPPIVVETEDGFEVVDGQHTAIAAASHPNVPLILVMIVTGAKTADRAAAFLGHNRDRLNVSRMQMHHAAVAAGDSNAILIDDVCRSAGLRVLRLPPTHGAYKARDTVALVAITTVVHRHGATRARAMLHVLAEAECKPASADAIKAVAFLMSEAEYRDDFRPEDLAVTIRATGEEAVREGRVFGIAHKLPAWRGLAVIWFKAVRKVRTKPVQASTVHRSPEPPSKQPQPMSAAQVSAPAPRRTIIDRRASGSMHLGEPAPGRSALDQRSGKA